MCTDFLPRLSFMSSVSSKAPFRVAIVPDSFKGSASAVDVEIGRAHV